MPKRGQQQGDEGHTHACIYFHTYTSHLTCLAGLSPVRGARPVPMTLQRASSLSRAATSEYVCTGRFQPHPVCLYRTVFHIRVCLTYEHLGHETYTNQLLQNREQPPRATAAPCLPAYRPSGVPLTSNGTRRNHRRPAAPPLTITNSTSVTLTSPDLARDMARVDAPGHCEHTQPSPSTRL